MIGDIGRLFQRPAIFRVGGNAGRAEGVVADSRVDTSRRRPAPHQHIGIRLRHGIARQLRCTPPKRLEQRCARCILQAGGFKIVIQVRLQRMVTG